MKNLQIHAFFVSMATIVFSGPIAFAQDPFGGKFNNYQCYQVTAYDGEIKPRDIKVKDQFGAYGQFIAKPAFVCNPVSINGEPVPEPKVHLACYSTDPNNNSGLKKQKVVISNRFGKQVVETAAVSQLVCVPSLKEHTK